MQYCQKCVYPMISANLIIDDEGICSACRLQEEFDALSHDFWKLREKTFFDLVSFAKNRAHGNYDCIVPVSGGKDSYFQVHKAIECGLKPLLVTYHGNNYLPEGQRNLDRMREKFGVDHMVFGPSVGTLIKLNRGCFEMMGDMNWHAHAGIKTFPMQVAVKFGIPLVIWGEITWSVSGMFSINDYVEYNKRTVFEHDMRGYTIDDMVEKIAGLNENDLAWLKMPSDQDFARTGVKGVYIGNFFKWEPNLHAAKMKELYGFEFAEKPFERTYRLISNLDDMHENGVHDYLKYIKFGYGRATDHASKDIRAGLISREKAIEIVKKYDHVKPRKDLDRWLNYVNMTEDEFDNIADSFRDPRVWWIDGERWWKHNIFGEPSPYEKVKLSEVLRFKYSKRNTHKRDEFNV